MRGEFGNHSQPVQVCSVQTLESRYLKTDSELIENQLPPADLIFFDECHVSLSSGYDKLRAKYPKAIIIGLTATPVLGNGKGLGKIYTDMVFGPTVKELTDMGFLVPVEYYGADPLDLSKVKIGRESGEFDENSLAETMDRKELIGDIVTNWKRICPERQTVLFASSVAHSQHCSASFNAAEVKAAHIDANTTDDERTDIFDRVHSGEIRVLCNYGICVEGWDEPQVSCAILAQPTRNPGRYIQMGGRVLRPFPEKSNSIIIDHSGNVTRHGWLDDDFEWKLDTSETIQERQFKKQNQEAAAPKAPRLCPKCKALFKGRKCQCGYEIPVLGRPVPVIDAELKRLLARSKPKKAEKPEPTRAEKQSTYSQLLTVADSKGYKPGWAAELFREKYGTYPAGFSTVREQLTPRVRGMAKRKMIAYWAMQKKLKKAA